MQSMTSEDNEILGKDDRKCRKRLAVVDKRNELLKEKVKQNYFYTHVCSMIINTSELYMKNISKNN